jgi:hypothetical protein
MHFMVAWSIDAPQGDWELIDNALCHCLDGYPWVRAFMTTHVVYIQTAFQWHDISEKLAQQANLSPFRVSYIMTPVMQGGAYDGVLEQKLWDAINKITSA